MTFKVHITETCFRLLAGLGDKGVRRTILKRIGKLAHEPESQGKTLVKELAGFRSVRAAGRYRVIYRVERQAVVVYILAAGIRKGGEKKDIYAIAKKLLNAGLLDSENPPSP